MMGCFFQLESTETWLVTKTAQGAIDNIFRQLIYSTPSTGMKLRLTFCVTTVQNNPVQKSLELGLSDSPLLWQPVWPYAAPYIWQRPIPALGHKPGSLVKSTWCRRACCRGGRSCSSRSGLSRRGSSWQPVFRCWLLVAASASPAHCPHPPAATKATTRHWSHWPKLGTGATSRRAGLSHDRPSSVAALHTVHITRVDRPNPLNWIICMMQICTNTRKNTNGRTNTNTQAEVCCKYCHMLICCKTVTWSHTIPFYQLAVVICFHQIISYMFIQYYPLR